MSRPADGREVVLRKILRGAMIGLALRPDPAGFERTMGGEAGSDGQLRRKIEQVRTELAQSGWSKTDVAKLIEDIKDGDGEQGEERVWCSTAGCPFPVELNGRCLGCHAKHVAQRQAELDGQYAAGPARAANFNGSAFSGPQVGRGQQSHPSTPGQGPGCDVAREGQQEGGGVEEETNGRPAAEPERAESAADPSGKESVDEMGKRADQCAVPGCLEASKTRGLCGKHYQRLNNGDADAAQYATPAATSANKPARKRLRLARLTPRKAVTQAPPAEPTPAAPASNVVEEAGAGDRARMLDGIAYALRAVGYQKEGSPLGAIWRLPEEAQSPVQLLMDEKGLHAVEYVVGPLLGNLQAGRDA